MVKDTINKFQVALCEKIFATCLTFIMYKHFYK